MLRLRSLALVAMAALWGCTGGSATSQRRAVSCFETANGTQCVETDSVDGTGTDVDGDGTTDSFVCGDADSGDEESLSASDDDGTGDDDGAGDDDGTSDDLSDSDDASDSDSNDDCASGDSESDDPSESDSTVDSVDSAGDDSVSDGDDDGVADGDDCDCGDDGGGDGGEPIPPI